MILIKLPYNLFYSINSSNYKINSKLARLLKSNWHQGDGRRYLKPDKDQEPMSYQDDNYSPRTDAGRFGRWLATRRAETWMFFAVGVFLGGLFF